MYDKILVAVDGSECSMVALDQARDLAETLGSTVYVVSVADVRLTFGESPAVGDAAHVVDYARQQAQSAVDAGLERLSADEHGFQTESEVLVGIPASELIEYVDEHDIDLVVIGTHGRSGLDRLLLGSVAERVIRSSSAPVLVVRSAS
jgi:nucleotide-binding universal stress UspA family protein